MDRLRLAVRIAATTVVTAVAAIAPATVAVVTRGAARPAAWIGSRVGHLWSRALCAVLGIEVRAHGRPPHGPFLVASNHLTYLDVVVLGRMYPGVFVARSDIRGWPVFGWIARRGGTLFLDTGRSRDVVRVGAEMRHRIAHGISVTVFPEGGTSRGDGVAPFLSSLLEPAAREGIPCFAVSLSYETPGVEAPPSRTICWYDDVPFGTHFLRLASLPRIVATVRFSPVPLAHSDRKELARMLRDEVVRGFVPVRQDPAYSLAGSHTSGPR
jgi:1-acyl-sn-glycerol-3-phosphate acyltransferase